MGVKHRYRRLGWVSEPGGVPPGLTRLPAAHRLYEALVPLACAACRRPIPTGGRFTLRHPPGTASPLPVCRACAPFSAPG